MRAILFHYLAAGDRDHPPEQLIRSFVEAGYEVDYRSTSDPDAWSALETDAALVIAAGGDGTVRKVATRLAGRGVPLALLPLGTANNIARSLGLGVEPVGPRELAAYRPRAVDLGMLRAGGEEKHFMESVGWGLFADGISTVKSELSASGVTDAEESIRHARAVFCRLSETARAAAFAVELDGESVDGRWLALEIMNIGMIGPRLRLAPESDPADGVLDVLLVREDGRAALTRWLERIEEDQPGEPPGELRRARRVRLPPEARALRIDSDMLGAEHDPDPVELTVEAHAVQVLTP